MSLFLRIASARRRPVFRAWTARALRGTAIALLSSSLVFAAAGPLVAEPAKVDVEARLEKGYGRLVLTFRGRELLPQYTLRQNNGVLVVDFSDEIDVDVDQIPLALSPYVTVVRRDPERKALRLALARQVRVNSLEAGEKLFLDFLPETWRQAPPPLPQDVVAALAKRAEAAMRAAREAEMAKTGSRITPKLDFRMARLPTFTRFSFGWNVSFDTKMTREGDRVTIAFNRSGAIDLSPVDLEPVSGLVDVFADPADAGLKVVFTVSPDADVRGFRDGDTYVLDLVRPTAPANAGEAVLRSVLPEPMTGRDRIVATGRPATSLEPAAGAPAPTPAPQPAAAPVATPASAPVAAASGVPAAAPAPKPAQPTTPAEPPARGAGGPAKAAAPAPAQSKPAALAETAAAKPAPTAAAPQTAPAPQSAAMPAKPVPAGVPTAVETRVVDLPPAGQGAGETAQPAAPAVPAGPVRSEGLVGELPAAAVPPRPAEGPMVVATEVKRIGDVVRITFPFAQKVPAAAFMRDGVLWVVFDTANEVAVAPIAPNLGPLARSVTATRSPTWTAMRIALTQPLLTTLSPDGNNWVLSVGEMVLEPTRPLKLRRFVRGDGNQSIKISLPDGGSVHELDDPVVGDRMVVVTAQAPSRGLLKPQQMVDLETLASAHGIALVPRSDDLRVSYDDGEVTIGSERGLSLSKGTVESGEPPVPRLQQPMLHRLPFDPAAFENHGGEDADRKARALFEAIVDGNEQPRRQSRIDLAEYQIGRRFAPEALAQLRFLAAEEPAITHDPGFVVLWGAAEVLAGRAAQARDTLSRSEVGENADAALWRTVAADDLGRFDEARESALKATGALGAYPKSIQALFNLAAGDAAIELKDYGFAQSRLAEIEPETIDPDLVGRLEVEQGRLADAAGRPEDAVKRFERAAATGDRRSQADAEYHLVRLLERDGKIDKETAIERLRSLSFGWRGDETELRTLRTLAGYLADTGRYRDAFQAMRSALQVDPDSPTTRLLQDEMGRRFLAIYLDDADKALSPLDALTLYYDFRELVPIGRRGDEVVRKLADRLVGVDLLPQAAELLSYQVDNRLKGAARAQIAADLAVIHLLDRKPERALAVLNKTRQSQIPQALERQRRLVEARALSDAGRGNTALELLATMTGSDVARLRADVMWKAKRWREASETLEGLLAGRWQDATPLDDQERQDVMRTAIGYALANDQLSLDRLRGKFQAKMAESPNAHTFDVVTRPIQSQGTEFRDIARDVAAVDTMRQFLQEYRAQYLDPRARTIVPDEPAKPAEGGADAAKPTAGPQAKAETPAKMAQADMPAAKAEGPGAKAEAPAAKTEVNAKTDTPSAKTAAPAAGH